MGFLKWVAIGVAAVFVWNFLVREAGPFAGSCIRKEEDKSWSFLTFSNGCDAPINVVFCNKLALGELGKLFGFATGEWDCRDYRSPPGHSFTTIKWTNERSSLASEMMSTSTYRVIACKSPYLPRFKDESNYVCEKP